MLGLTEVDGLEPLCEPFVDLLEELPRLRLPPLVAEKSTQAHCRPQLSGPGFLALRDVERRAIAAFSSSRIVPYAAEQVASRAQEFRVKQALAPVRRLTIRLILPRG